MSNHLNENIELLRHSNKLTQKQLADKMGISTMTIQKRLYNQGEWKLSEIQELSKLFKISEKDIQYEKLI